MASLGAVEGDYVAREASTHGLVGAWAAPVVGQSGALAVIVGFHGSVSPLQEDQVRLLELFSTMAGAAIERGRLVESLRGRNRALVGLRGVLETLAGPDFFSSGFDSALDALCSGVGSGAAALWVRGEAGDWVLRAASIGLSDHRERSMRDQLEGSAADSSTTTATATVEWSRGGAALACWWQAEAQPNDARQIVEDAANSFRLALEREVTLEAMQETAALQRTREFERQLTLRLGHELRTPLTAIKGFASTMLQPDVQWPEAERERFLGVIEREAVRMSRLVDQLFDEAAIDSGALRLQLNYCDLVAVLLDAASVSAPVGSVTFDVPEAFTIWGDQDRLQQIFVNLISNASRHNPEDTLIKVLLHPDGNAAVRVLVTDTGDGIPAEAAAYLNGDVAERPKDQGLGLRLVKGLVEAHHGSVHAMVEDGTTVTVRLPVDRAEV